MRYIWPGNIRELINTVERAVVEAEGKPIGKEHLHERIRNYVAVGNNGAANLKLNENERQLIIKALKDANGSKTEAARLLGITRRKLYSRMKILNVRNADVGRL